MSVLLFTYGLLMGRFELHRELGPARLVGRGFIEGYTLLELGGFPGAVPGKDRVYGEVYEIEEARLARLDHVEEEGILYRRKEVDVYFDEARLFSETAQFYEYIGPLPDNAGKIPDGDYAGEKGCLNYFAYGASLAPVWLKERNVSWLDRIPAILRDHTLVFNSACRQGGCAGIKPCKEAQVFGALYRITRSMLDRVGQDAGCPDHGRLRVVRVQDKDGGIYYAWTHAEGTRMVSDRPREDCLRYIVEGLRELGWYEAATWMLGHMNKLG